MIYDEEEFYEKDIKVSPLLAYISLLCQISELPFIHKKKFGVVPFEQQIEKLWEEFDEVRCAYKKPFKKEHFIEELMDVIIVISGLSNTMGFSLTDELKKKLKKVARAKYKANHHIGKYNE